METAAPWESCPAVEAPFCSWWSFTFIYLLYCLDSDSGKRGATPSWTGTRALPGEPQLQN